MRRDVGHAPGACRCAVRTGQSETLDAYLGGQLSSLDALAIATGGTAFQRLIWRALRAIPAGSTLSYGQLAAQLGRPSAARAVGLGNGANAIAIVVSCHRVIGANGALTGYAGGTERKRWLLDHEARARSEGDAFAHVEERVRSITASAS